jgi:phospholipid transport system substrate-binding protein
MIKKVLILGLLCGSIDPIFSSAYAQTAPVTRSARDDVKATIDQIIQIVSEHPGDENIKTRRLKLRQVINPRFDFEDMAKRSLGAHWNSISAEEQRDFVAIFSDLLARTYLSKIETVKPGMVKIEGEDGRSPGTGANESQRSTVKTTVTTKGNAFPINYQLSNVNGEWKVYDVVIEQISLIANYRNEFAGIIRKEKFEGLMKRLRDKAAA